MKKTALVFSLLAISLAACSKQPTTEEKTAVAATSEVTASQPVSATSEVSAPAPTADTAQTALDWAGTYKGTMPCADCDGIKTKLKLNDNKTYELSRKYEGNKNTEQKSKVEGTFTFDAKNPSIISLGAPENRKIFIGENFVQFLDEDGNKITGPMADLYKLTKD
jgi:uncharacterized lipoprotein NlpE involved in copper resistance